MNRFYIVLGDWSSDGHGKSDKVLIESPTALVDIQQAYKSSRQKTGISFHDEYDGGKHVNVCAEYEDNTMSRELFLALKKFNCPFKEIQFDVEGNGDITEKNFRNVCFSRDSFVNLLMWFIGLSLPDFKWNRVKDEIPCFNGYWQKDMNHQLGYGLYT